MTQDLVLLLAGLVFRGVVLVAFVYVSVVAGAVAYRNRRDAQWRAAGATRPTCAACGKARWSAVCAFCGDAEGSAAVLRVLPTWGVCGRCGGDLYATLNHRTPGPCADPGAWTMGGPTREG